MGLENKKFMVKGCDTVYKFGCLMNGQWPIIWTNSSGEDRYDSKTELFVYEQLNSGRWYLLNDVVNTHGPKEEEECTKATKLDAVNHPKHYCVFEKLEAIEIIASSMTVEQFYGYCLGNILKYRLRAGGKDDVMQELGKADKYQELFTQFKSLCKDAV